MYNDFQKHLTAELDAIKEAGLYKSERLICSPQSAEITVAGKQVLNFCANNYLGLANNPELIKAAKEGMDARGFGMASVRFICGCQDLHKKLEEKISRCIASEEMIADTASDKLYEIRRKMRHENNRIRDSLQKYITGGYYGNHY